MRVLVTGGAGYIGSHAVKRLAQAGHEVTVWDNLSQGHLAAVPTATRFLLGDVGNQEGFTEVLRRYGIEAVMHFAAFIEVGESVADPAKYYANNLRNGLALLSALREAGVGRLVFSSTAAVYGNPRVTPIPEDHPLDPINPYGRTKAMMELAIADHARAYGLAATCLRYFNVAGASPDGEIGEAHEPESHLIPRVLATAVGTSEPIAVFGTDYPTPDGTCVRDYVHVVDLVEAHLLALGHQTPGTVETYNVGSERGFSVREVIAACEAVIGRALPARAEPRRPGDPPVLVAASERIRRELGWQPRYPCLAQMVEHAWQWTRSMPASFKAHVPARDPTNFLSRSSQ
jgi:UDP-glucose 4-epimerase